MRPVSPIYRVSSKTIASLLLPLISLAGCSGKEGSPELATSGPAITPAQVRAADCPIAVSSKEPTVIPDTADQALRAVLEGLHDNRPAAVWDALPASYQQEVNDLVHLFARRMHPEAWKWLVKISRKGAVVLRLPHDNREEASVAGAAGGHEAENSDAIEQASGTDRVSRLSKENAKVRHLLGSDQDRAPQTRDTPADQERREAIARFLDRIADTGPAGLDFLKSVDVGTLLRREEGRALLEAFHAATAAAMGPQALQDLFDLADDLSQVQLVLKEASAETAIVEIVFPNDVPGEIECVRVDGKWIPRGLAESWAETMGNLKQSVLEALPSETASENFGPVFQYLGMLDLSFDAELAHARQDASGDDMPAEIGRSVLLDAPMMVLEFLILGPYVPEPGEALADADGILMDLPQRSEPGADGDVPRAAVSVFEQIVGKSLAADGKRVAVLCRAPAAVHTEHPAFAVGIIENLTRRFQAGKIDVIEAEKIVAWVGEHTSLAADSDLTALGTDLAADYIVQVHIETLGFSEENFPELRRGRAKGHVSVAEITADGDGGKASKIIFKQPFESNYPPGAPIAADAEEADAFKQRYLGRLHFELSRLFLSEP